MGMGNPDLLASPKAAEEKPAFTHMAMNMLIGEYGPTQSLTHPCACGYDLSTSELLSASVLRGLTLSPFI